MNITLSANEELIERARAYARRHGTTLNNLIRAYLEQITNELDRDAAAEEFSQLCKENAGTPDRTFRFNRSDVYDRHSSVKQI